MWSSMMWLKCVLEMCGSVCGCGLLYVAHQKFQPVSEPLVSLLALESKLQTHTSTCTPFTKHTYPSEELCFAKKTIHTLASGTDRLKVVDERASLPVSVCHRRW